MTSTKELLMTKINDHEEKEFVIWRNAEERLDKLENKMDAVQKSVNIAIGIFIILQIAIGIILR